MKQHAMPKDVRWIGPRRKAGDDFPIETTYFKTIFTRENSCPHDDGLTLHISANNRYCLYVNGIEVINGPCKGDYWHQYCDEVDITPYLVTGTNVVAAKVTAYADFEAANAELSNFGPFWAVTNNAGPLLILHGICRDANGSEVYNLSTGIAPWYCQNDEAISWRFSREVYHMGCTEEVDGAKIPFRWNSDIEIGKDFTPAIPKWNNTVNYGEIPKLFLYDRPIKPLLRLENNDLTVFSASEGFAFPLSGSAAHDANGSAIQPEKTVLPPHGTYEAVLDAKRLTTSFLTLSCAKGTGSKVTLLYSEGYVKQENGRRYKESRSDATGVLAGCVDIYHPGGLDESYSPSWFRTFRFIKVTIETKDEALVLYPINLTETRFPLENRVQFDAPHTPWLKNVWDISLRTLELCMHDSYEDCPYYEQMQYTMDTRLQMLFTYSVSHDADLPRKTIHDFHTSILPEGIIQSRFPTKYPQVIPAFSLHWIFMLKDYYFETGDLELVRRYRVTMESILDWFKRKTGPQGLVENLGYWDFADWTEAWDDIAGVPRAALHGPSTIHNLIYAYALGEGAFLMEALGYDHIAALYRQESDAIKDRVMALCWSNDKQLFREGPAFEEYTQHAQMWAVLSGLSASDHAKKLMHAVLSDVSLIPCSFVMQYYLFRALEKAELYEETEALWDLWKNLLTLDLTTVPEIPGEKTRSDCHAWGALLLHELPCKLLGITPLTPGYQKLQIRPMGLYIEQISGTAPTPYGEVSVSWRVEGGRFLIEGSTPVETELVLPDGTVYTVAKGNFSYSTDVVRQAK